MIETSIVRWERLLLATFICENIIMEYNRFLCEKDLIKSINQSTSRCIGNRDTIMLKAIIIRQLHHYQSYRPRLFDEEVAARFVCSQAGYIMVHIYTCVLYYVSSHIEPGKCGGRAYLDKTLAGNSLELKWI